MTMSKTRGFTLIELLIVMTILALLVSIAAPRYFRNIDKTKEAVLREDLFTMRSTLDKFYEDTGKYPDSLQELVDRRYLRNIPADPMTGSDKTWVIVPPDDPKKGGIFNVRSGSKDKARDGTFFSDW